MDRVLQWKMSKHVLVLSNKMQNTNFGSYLKLLERGKIKADEKQCGLVKCDVHN